MSLSTNRAEEISRAISALELPYATLFYLHDAIPVPAIRFLRGICDSSAINLLHLKEK